MANTLVTDSSDDEELLEIEEYDCAMTLLETDVASPQIPKHKLYRQYTIPVSFWRPILQSRNGENSKNGLRFKSPVSIREPEHEPMEKKETHRFIVPKYIYDYKSAL